MRTRVYTSVAALLIAAVGVLWSAPVAGQAPTTPRTPEGHPDLQGVWDYRTITTMQRAERFGDNEFLTEEEAAALEAEKLTADLATPEDRQPSGGAFPTGGRTVGAGVDEQSVASVWFDDGIRFGGAGVIPSRRTSLIIDPPNGRIPSKPRDTGGQRGRGRRRLDGHEDLSLSTRCMQSLTAGPPMRPGPYNNNVQIFQAPGYVVFLHEMMHDARVVPLDGRPPLPDTIRQWMGDSRGYWDGDTLVVETTNYNEKGSQFGSNVVLRVVEQYTLADAETLNFQFTVTDPTVFEQPWTAAFPLRKSDGQLYEYACHEGNYALPNTLAGARADEARAAAEAEGAR